VQPATWGCGNNVGQLRATIASQEQKAAAYDGGRNLFAPRALSIQESQNRQQVRLLL
jgi:hypothetical protein